MVAFPGVDLKVFDWRSPHNAQTVESTGRKYPAAHTAGKSSLFGFWNTYIDPTILKT